MAHPNTSPKLQVLVVAPSLRAETLNEKLAALAASVAEQVDVVVDHASMSDFNAPLYDGDRERSQGRGSSSLANPEFWR